FTSGGRGIYGGGTATKTGWIDFNNSGGEEHIESGQWYTLPNDGLGAFTNLTGTNGLVGLDFLDNDELDLSKLNRGDSLFIRTDIRIIPAVNGAFCEFRVKLGEGANTYYLTRQLGIPPNGAGIEYEFQFTDYIYLGDDNTADNMAGFQINSSEDADVYNLGIAVQIISQV
ncbi:MAG: hypothetical protein GY906_22980, partial [bacterium]|nr:hypothetical protein [bacterium]